MDGFEEKEGGLLAQSHAMSRRNFITLLGVTAGTVMGSMVLGGCSSGGSSSTAPTEVSHDDVTITDMAGRTVTYRSNPERVFSASPASEAWLCALVPDRLIGWSNTMSDQQLQYYPEAVASAPLIGGWYGYTQGNTEGIIAEAPDIVIYAADVSTDATKATATSSVDKLSQKLGVPVVCVSYGLEDAPGVMRTLGEWLGVKDRGDKFADYMQAELDKVKATVNKVSSDKVVTYYYAEAVDGLKTESASSFHSAVFQYCGLKCATDVAMSSFMGMEQVSMEQVLGWNPQYVFVYNDNAYATIKSDSNWSDIKAVKDGHVYLCPSCPQNWFDRSPNPLRVLGCLYTAARCYPDQVTYKLDDEVRTFFKTLYDRDITDSQIKALYEKGTASN